MQLLKYVQSFRLIVVLLPGVYTLATKRCASAGNRTRIYCLEGNNANLYTTDAAYSSEQK